MKVYPVKNEDLKAKGALLLEHVLEGLEGYPNFLVQGDSAALSCFLQTCLEENPGEAYADFYYSRLTEEQQRNFRAGLSSEELQVLELFVLEEGEVYYPLSAEILPFLADITVRGWLFSTFYFTKHPCTIWGNYDGKYPVFCRDTKEECFYREAAAKCGLMQM